MIPSEAFGRELGHSSAHDYCVCKVKVRASAPYKKEVSPPKGVSQEQFFSCHSVERMETHTQFGETEAFCGQGQNFAEHNQGTVSQRNQRLSSKRLFLEQTAEALLEI